MAEDEDENGDTNGSPTSHETQPKTAPMKPQMDATNPSCFETGHATATGGDRSVGCLWRNLSAVFLMVSERTSEISLFFGRGGGSDSMDIR